MPITCLNPECDAHEVPISNESGLPLEDAKCGQCGGPLVDTDAQLEPEAAEAEAEADPPAPA